MANLDQILLRLPRKTPDADFVDRLVAQISVTGIPAPTPSITHPHLFLLKPDGIETALPVTPGGAEVMQAESKLFPLPVMQKGPSPDVYRFTNFRHQS